MNLLKYIFAALALVLGAMLVPTLANAEDSGEPCVETEDRTETAWVETDPGAPWVATGESREKTPAGEDTVQTSDWLTAPPPGEGWMQVGQRTADGALLSAAVDQWWHWTGPSDPTGPPPGGEWGQDSGDHSGFPTDTNTIFNESRGGSGNASWFYHQVTAAVYAQVTQYMYQRTIPGTAVVMEYVFSRLIKGIDCPPDEEPVDDECPDGQVGTPPNCDDDDEPPVDDCPDGQVGTPPNCDDDDDVKPQPPVGNPGNPGNPGTTPPTGGSGGQGSTGPTGTTPTGDTPMIETPGPGEEVVFQSFDDKGNLVEQRVSQPIPGAAQQEGM
jgi:hypothetical protein